MIPEWQQNLYDTYLARYSDHELAEALTCKVVICQIEQFRVEQFWREAEGNAALWHQKIDDYLTREVDVFYTRHSPDGEFFFD